MGYRSDVAIACTKECYIRHALLLKDFNEVSNIKRMENDDNFYWFFTEWKWYSRYPEVNMFNKFVEEAINYCDETGPYSDYDIGFIRIGEEVDDIEVLGDPYSRGLDVYRSIDTPLGMVGVGDDRLDEN